MTSTWKFVSDISIRSGAFIDVPRRPDEQAGNKHDGREQQEHDQRPLRRTPISAKATTAALAAATT